MRRAHTWGWRRTRHYDEPPNDLRLSSSHQSCPDCIIATPGYDFREGQALDSGAIDSMTIVKLARCVTQTTKNWFRLASPSVVFFPPCPAAASSSRSCLRAGPWTSLFSALRALPPTCAQAWPLPCCVSNSSCVPRRASLLWPWLSPVTCRRQDHLNTNQVCCPLSERFATLPTQKTLAFAREPEA